MRFGEVIITLAVIAAIVIIYVYSQRPVQTEVVVEQPGDWWGPWYGPWWWHGGDGGDWPWRPHPRPRPQPHPKPHPLGPGGLKPIVKPLGPGGTRPLFGSGSH